MSDDNLTAVLYDVNDIRLEQKPIPLPKDDEVLLRMACVGICGSDIHYWVYGRCADFILKAPMIMGHEASGTVAQVGKNVKHLKPGDRVAVEPGVPCRLCSHCKEGRYNLCLDMVFCATPPVDGNLARYYTHPADFCFKIPDHMSLEEAAMLEPLSVGVHACRRAGVTLGSTVLIIGAGPIGLVSLLTAKAMGAAKCAVTGSNHFGTCDSIVNIYVEDLDLSATMDYKKELGKFALIVQFEINVQGIFTIHLTDIVPFRLGVAKELGADFTLQVKPQETEKELTTPIEKLIGGKPQITIDCTGFQSTIRLAMEATASGGVIVVVGMGSTEVNVPLTAVAAREVDIRGVFRYANDYPLALAMVASGKVNVKRLITHHFDIEETVKAFETAKSGEGNPIKIMIHCEKK